jgi:hypothetical protein
LTSSQPRSARPSADRTARGGPKPHRDPKATGRIRELDLGAWGSSDGVVDSLVQFAIPPMRSSAAASRSPTTTWCSPPPYGFADSAAPPGLGRAELVRMVDRWIGEPGLPCHRRRRGARAAWAPREPMWRSRPGRHRRR